MHRKPPYDCAQMSLPSTFDHAADFNPADDFDAFLRRIPARWVVYLLADAQDQPVQLLCVRNLRASLKRRLGSDQAVGPSRRINYRDLIRRIHWQRVDSAFEADWLYYEAARRLFPQSYQGMIGFRSAWFLHVDPDAEFPRYIKTIDLSPRPGVFVGPLEDKHAAARLIETIEDLFDLCRFYNILLQSPRGKACAYKEMGKCPAPCDGSISLPQYRRLIQWSLDTLINPQPSFQEQQPRLQDAAASMQFESAAKIKAYAAQLEQLGKGALRHVRPLSDFRYVSLQRGPREQSAKLLAITPGRIELLAGLIAGPDKSPELLDLIQRHNAAASDVVDSVGAERIGIVSHHLFAPKQASGVFLCTQDLTASALAKAWKDLQKQKNQDDSDDEGLLKELQAM
jgi:excinuclease UvrABC nuclease subunit